MKYNKEYTYTEFITRIGNVNHKNIEEAKSYLIKSNTCGIPYTIYNYEGYKACNGIDPIISITGKDPEGNFIGYIRQNITDGWKKPIKVMVCENRLEKTEEGKFIIHTGF